MLLAYADCSVLPALFDLAKDVFDALDGYNPDVVTTFLLILRECVFGETGCEKRIAHSPRIISVVLPRPSAVGSPIYIRKPCA